MWECYFHPLCFFIHVLCADVDVVGDGKVDRQDVIRASECVAEKDPACDFNGDGVVNSDDIIPVKKLQGCKMGQSAFVGLGGSHGPLSIDYIFFTPGVGWQAEVFALGEFDASFCGPKVVGPQTTFYCGYTISGCSSHGCVLTFMYELY